jgi:hypothetical protein
VLVDREVVVAALLVEADRGAELRQQLDEDAGVAREPQRAGGLRAEQELRELAHPVRGQAAADPLARDELHGRRFLAHLDEQLLVGLEPELGDEAQRADDSQRVLAEALGRDRAQTVGLEVRASPEGVDELAGVQPARHRVDGEIAAAHVVLDRELRVGDDLEVVPARAGGDLLARRRELDPRARQAADPAVAGMEPDADEPVGDHEVLDPAVGGGGGGQPLGVEPRHEEVRVLRVDPEQLVADGASHEVGVEPERAHVFLDLLHREKRYAFPP